MGRTLLSTLQTRLPKEEFLRLYVEERLPGREIASQRGLQLKDIYRLKRAYEVSTLPKWARRDMPSLEVAPLRSIVLGSMLGDGALTPIKDSIGGFSFKEAHAVSQQGYLEWKRSIWGSWAYPMHVELTGTTMQHPSGTGPIYQCQPQCAFGTVVHGAFEPWWEVFYRNADRGRGGQRLKKYRASDVLRLVGGVSGLDATALAVWYMDDGTASSWPTFCVGPRNRREAGRLLRLWGFDPTETDSGQELHGYAQAARFLEYVQEIVLAREDLAYKIHNLSFPRGAVRAQSTQDRMVSEARQKAETEEEENRIRAEICTLGVRRSATRIADELDVSRRKVIKVLGEAGIEPRRKLTRQLEEDLDPEILRRAEAGEPVAQLAREFGWSYANLIYRLDWEGAQRRSRGEGNGISVYNIGVTRAEFETVWRECGGVIRDMVQRLGIGWHAVSHRMKVWGLKVNQAPQRPRTGKNKNYHSQGPTREEFERVWGECLGDILEVARHLGVTQAAVQVEMRRWGMKQALENRRKPIPLSELDRALRGELTQATLGREYGVSGSTIHLRIHEAIALGTLTRPPKKPTEPKKAKPRGKPGRKPKEIPFSAFVRVLQGEVSQKDLALELGLSEATLSRRIQEGRAALQKAPK